MVRNAQEYINNIINKRDLYSLDLSRQELSGAMDLKEFTNLVNIIADVNEFTNLDWLFTLPEKSQKKLKRLNLWGNKITKVDFARLLTDFPSLELVNLENNPLNLSELSNLNNQQFSQLVEKVRTKKLKINSLKGNSSLDFLEYIEQLRKENAELKQQLQAQIEVSPK